MDKKKWPRFFIEMQHHRLDTLPIYLTNTVFLAFQSSSLILTQKE